MTSNNNANKKQVSNTKDRKGDTGRTSSQRQKAASGGGANTNNRGQRKGV